MMELVVDLLFFELLGEIVGNLIMFGDLLLNNDFMKKVKVICKKLDVYVKYVYYLVLIQFKKNYVEIRFLLFQIINEFFFCFYIFREMLLIDFQIFLEFIVEIDYRQLFLLLKVVVKVFKEKVIEVIDSWYCKFGLYYKKLDLGYNYLKRVKNVEFNFYVV